MKELFVIEATRPGWGHASFNAAVLHALVNRANARGVAVKVFCERGHSEALALLLPKGDCSSWESIRVVDGFRRHFAWKFIVEFSVVFRLLLRARRQRAGVVLLATFPNVLAAVLLMKPIFKSVRVHIMLHGELESLILEEKQPIYKEGFWTKLAVLKLFSGDWPSLYVLGEGIRRRILSTFAERKQLQNIRAIKHPYLFAEAAVPQPVPRQHPLRIGFVGAGRVIKGVIDFFGLAKSMSRYVDEGLVEFVVVGGVEPAALPSKNEYALVLADKVVSLSASDYSRAIAELDCAVFLPRQDYSLTASGSVFDVVNHGIEIFSTKNCYFADIAQLDDEGGIKFFDDVRAMAAEIARRAERGGEFFQRFKYIRIKREHSERALDTLISEVFASADSYSARRADCADDQVR